MASQTSKEKSKRKTSGIKVIGGLLFAKMMRGAASELRANAEEINRLNVFPVPDGDTGDNMSMTMESGIAALESVDSDDLAEVMRVASRGMMLGARGNSGVILSQFFAGIAKGFESSEVADAHTLGKALELGVEQAYTSVMTPTEGTILTVAREAVEYAVSRINEHSTVRHVFGDLVKEMQRSLERTPELMTLLKSTGVVDSGAAGLYYIMNGLNKVLNGIEIEESPKDTPKALDATAVQFGPNSSMTYGYCTELLLQLQSSKCDINDFDTDALKPELSMLGDSIVIFKAESIVKLHIHTKTPEKVLELCHRYGEFTNVKIENMTLQHTETAKLKEYAIVAVSSGGGIESIFKELGADVIINNSISNPAIGDFITAFDKAYAKVIYVFPNNSNIFMAANQAAEIYERSEVYVIDSCSIGDCYAILSSVGFEAESTERVLARVNAVNEIVETAYVCTAVKDAEMNGISVRSGDVIGIINKQIIACEKDVITAAAKAIDRLLSNGTHTALTIFAGKDSNKKNDKAITEYLSAVYSDCEVFLFPGEQEIYSYIFVAE